MAKEKEIRTLRRRETPVKKRGVKAYDAKIRQIRKWHMNRVKWSGKPQVESPNTKLLPKRRGLQPVEYYINQVKKPN